MKFFIIHGSYGNPEENWFPWLKDKLESVGHTVFVPEFPTPKNQTLKNWTIVFEKYIDKIDNDTIFIGHSLGPSFILSLLEKLNLPKPIKTCFLISGFIGLLNNEEFDEINKTFVEKEFNWDKIKKNCKKFYIIHSDNDPYVSIEKAEELAEKLGFEVILIKGAGHFNTKSGYSEFPELLKRIKDESEENKEE